MAGRFSIEAIIKAVDKVTAPVTRMQNSVQMFTRNTEKSFKGLNKSVDNFSSNAMGAAKSFAAVMVVPVGAMIHAIKTGAEFEQAMVGAASKFGGIKKGSEAFKEIENAALKAGRTTQFTATESANALTELAAAGFSAKIAIAALPLVIDMATAAGTDLATTTTMLSDTMGAFGLITDDPIQAVKNMQRVMDVMSVTADKSTLSIEEIYESFRKAGPLAHTAGQSIETVSAILGMMASNSVKAEVAGTGVQNMFLNMAKPTTAAEKWIKKLNLRFLDAKGNFKDMPQIIAMVNKAMAGMSNSQKMSALADLFGREGISGIAATFNMGADAFAKFRKEFETGAGSTSAKAAMMRDTVQGSYKGMMSAIEGVEIAIFNMNEGGIKGAIDKTTEWIRANQDLIATKIGSFLEGIVNNFENIVIWTERIAIGIGIFLAFVTVLKTFVLIMTVVNLVMSMNPFGLMVLSVIALIAGLTALTVWVADISGGFDKLGDSIMTTLSPLNMLMKGIKWVKDNGMGILNTLGFGEGPQPIPARAQVVSPQDRTARSIEERRTTGTAEVTIMDQTGRARATGGTMKDQLKIKQTGTY